MRCDRAARIPLRIEGRRIADLERGRSKFFGKLGVLVPADTQRFGTDRMGRRRRHGKRGLYLREGGERLPHLRRVRAQGGFERDPSRKSPGTVLLHDERLGICNFVDRKRSILIIRHGYVGINGIGINGLALARSYSFSTHTTAFIR